MKVKIYPSDPNNKHDAKTAKILEKLIESRDYGDIVDSIVAARTYIENAYGLKTPNMICDRIGKAVVEWDIKNTKKAEKGDI